MVGYAYGMLLIHVGSGSHLFLDSLLFCFLPRCQVSPLFFLQISLLSDFPQFWCQAVSTLRHFPGSHEPQLQAESQLPIFGEIHIHSPAILCAARAGDNIMGYSMSLAILQAEGTMSIRHLIDHHLHDSCNQFMWQTLQIMTIKLGGHEALQAMAHFRPYYKLQKSSWASVRPVGYSTTPTQRWARHGNLIQVPLYHLHVRKRCMRISNDFHSAG